MLSTAEPLTKALDTLFRRKTVNVAAFANGDGPVSEISLGYFSSDHVKKHPEKSSNGFAVEHVVLMARALADEIADYRAAAGWRGLDEAPFEGYAYGVDDFYSVSFLHPCQDKGRGSL